jgi:putative hemolysin
MEQYKEFISIEKVLAGKNPRLLKLLPKFLLRYLKRIIHQDELNKGLNEFGHKKNDEFIEEGFKILQVNYTIEGLDELDPNNRYLFASNHPLGGLDGMVLIHALRKKFKEIKVPSNDLLMNIAQLQDNFIPVNKHGSQSKEVALLSEETYASNTQMMSFPAGLCSRKQGGKIEDLEWKKNFIAKAIKHKRYVVPVFFRGRNSAFFYNLSRIRTFLGIKLNIEMLYLVDEMFKQKGKTFHVIVGKPIPYETFDKSRTPQQWASWVKAQVYQLNKV